MLVSEGPLDLRSYTCSPQSFSRGARQGAIGLALALAQLMCVGAGAADDQKSEEATLVVRGVDGKPIRLTKKELAKLPRTEVEVVDHSGGKSRYSGVALRSILDRVNVPKGESLRGEWMRAFVSVEANDDYRVIFGLAELDPGFTDHLILLADARDGKPLEKYKGPFQIIVPGDKRQARWVRMVKEIRVVDSRTLDESKKKP